MARPASICGVFYRKGKDVAAKIRLGIVGLGFGEKVHLPAFRLHPRFEIVALCARHESRAKNIASRWKIPQAFGDWRRMLKQSDLDAISIATPPNIQPRIAQAAIDQGMAVFCEKPLAASYRMASEVARKAKKKKLPNLVDFEFPEIPEWQLAKLFLDKGKIGQLRHIHIHWHVETYANRAGIQSWKTESRTGGGTLYLFASHALYNLEWLAGRINKLSCALHRASDLKGSGDTMVSVSAEMKSKAFAEVSISTHSIFGNGHRVEIQGSRGTLILDNPTKDYCNGFRLFLGKRGGGLKQFKPKSKIKMNTHDGRIAAVAGVVSKFANWIDKGVPASPSFEDALRVQNLLAIAQRSHRTKKWVNCF